MRKCLIRKLDAIIENENLPIYKESISIKEISNEIFSVQNTGASFVDSILNPTSDKDAAKNRLYLADVYKVNGKKLKFIFKPLEDYGLRYIHPCTPSGWTLPYVWESSTGNVPSGTINNVTYTYGNNHSSFSWESSYPKAGKTAIYAYDVTDLTDEQIANIDWNDERFLVAGTETYIEV